MLKQFSFKTFLFILCISPTLAFEKGSIDIGNNPERIFLEDSVTEVTITFRPSFINKSTLHIDRIKREVTFRVDTLYHKYRVSKRISLSLKKFQRRTRVERFWRAEFIESLQMDTTKGPALDGMSVRVDYVNRGQKFWISTGNVRTKRVDRAFLDLLDLLDRKSSDQAMKIYLKALKKYFCVRE